MTDNSHTACSILVNTPITYAYEHLWQMLLEQNKWTEGSKISKKSAAQIIRNITTAEIDVKQKIQKIVKDRKISFTNQTGNLNGDYFYHLDQNGKGQVILSYGSSATRNGLSWPPKYAIQQELVQLKNALQYKHHGPKIEKKGLCC